MPGNSRSINSLPHLELRPRAEWEAKGWWGQTPLWSRVKKQASLNPKKTAVIDESGSMTYGELWKDAVRCAAVLQHQGLKRGNIVLVQLPNWREYTTIMLGCELANIIFAFCPIKWGIRECTRVIKLLRPSLWITSANYLGEDRTDLINSSVKDTETNVEIVILRTDDRDFLSWSELIDQAPSLSEADAVAKAGSGLDPLEIAVTSGTTGTPKGVIHAHDTVLETVQSTINRQGISSKDIIHLALPVGHTFGYLYGVRCALQAGGTLVMQESWDPYRMAELVETNGATVTLGTAAFIIDILDAGDDVHRALKNIWLFTQSGDALPKAVVERAINALPFRISRALGMTEFGHVTSTDENTPFQRLIDSAGSAQEEIKIVIADDEGKYLSSNQTGRILVKGPAVCAGYLIEDGTVIDVVDELGFFDTGDIGRLDDQNFLHVTGRSKNVLRRGAETIPIADLEEVLSSHPDIDHAIIVGIPDDRLGELPLACIQIRDGRKINLKNVRLWFDDQGVTRKFWPTDIYVVEQWPKGPTGKIDNHSLITSYLEKK